MIESYLFFNLFNWGCHGCDRMVVGFTTTCAIRLYREDEDKSIYKLYRDGQVY
jgi:hypothetical protein